ncbi:MAG: ATP-binding protein [Pirellulaceae bacterium]|nr:ATP-binding protein [Pirellulaceae bacterium]
MSSLFVIQGRDQGKRFDLGAGTLFVGRDPANQILLHDSEVSRRHAELRTDDQGEVHFYDLGSSNGSHINGAVVKEKVLVSGDRVQLGQTLLIFTGVSKQSSSTHEVQILSSTSRDESRILNSFAPQEVGSPQESSWLASSAGFKEGQEELNYLQILYKTALVASQTIDNEHLYQEVLETIFKQLSPDRACILLYDSLRRRFVPQIQKFQPRLQKSQAPFVISETILDYIFQQKEGVLTTNARQDERFEDANSIVSQGVQNAICVPLLGRVDVLGAIYVDTFIPAGTVRASAKNRYTENHLKLMVAIAQQTAFAVENRHYYSSLVQAERLATMGQTIAMISHHIKNILQGIQGGSYLVNAGLKDQDLAAVTKGWEIVEKNQDRISRLVLDMLSFSKERQPEVEPENLNDIVTEICELMKEYAANKEVALKLTVDSALPIVCFDKDSLHKAILNIVSNAIDACEDDNGEVTLSTYYLAKERMVGVEVVDTGCGIALDRLESIFSIFESSKGTKGTGLGLAISQKILKEHGGDIFVESELGKGSRFQIQLPAVFPSQKTYDSSNTLMHDE